MKQHKDSIPFSPAKKYILKEGCSSEYRSAVLTPYYKRISDGALFAKCTRCGDSECIMEIVEDMPETNPTDLIMDEPVLVYTNDGKWYNRHFAGYGNGTVLCWMEGKTSFTTTISVPWKYWKRPERKLIEEVVSDLCPNCGSGKLHHKICINPNCPNGNYAT
jgi:hypothetical protein